MLENAKPGWSNKKGDRKRHTDGSGSILIPEDALIFTRSFREFADFGSFVCNWFRAPSEERMHADSQDGG
jgi:hypothetical protein